jgi:thiol-disulfide isomerase/thioredoxin
MSPSTIARPEVAPRHGALRALATVVVACALVLASCSKKHVDANEVPPVAVSGTPLPAFDSPAQDPAVGTIPPVLNGQDFTGHAVTVDPTKGPLMLVFLAHWCPHCNAEVPRLIQWKASGEVPADLNVIGITTAVQPNAAHYPPSTWIKQIGWPWPVMGDDATSDAAQAYGLTSFPYFVVVGADGKVKLRFAGEIEIDDLTKLVDQALAS